MATVEVRTVTKRFDDVWAVKSASFTAQTGSFVTLLGPSGCGKTTSLRMIAGFEIPDEGEIYIGDRPITNVPPWRRNLGFVFQSYALFPHLSVFDNIAFGLKLQRVDRNETEARVNAILELVNLPGLQKRYPRQLSGGQQQRVALARALVVRPRVLLLDEPLSNLDAKLRAEMRSELKRIQREAGVTAIYVTHDQEEALAMSDQIVVMNRGEVRQIGTPQDIWERPHDEFVADFLGMENLLPGRVADLPSDGHLLVRCEDSEATMLATASDDLRSGDRVTLGIRSRAVEMYAQEPEGMANVVSGQIYQTSYRGDFVSYEIRTSLSARHLVASAPAAEQYPQSMWIRLAPENLLVLKREKES